MNLTVSEVDTYSYERSLHALGFSCVAGTDEAGRGPLAGPVVAASVVLPPEVDTSVFVDSKKISEKRRLFLASYLDHIGAAIGIGIVSEQIIDQINILQASLLAMRRSIEDLAQRFPKPDFILVDGKFTIQLDLPQQALIHGESRSASIAAASIIAKTKRDAIMVDLHQRYPQYNFAGHKGYPTRAHKEALRTHGPSPVHRLTFRGVQQSDI